MKIAKDEIQRLHLVDLDIAPLPDEDLNSACAELTTGLLVQHSVLIEVGPGAWPVVRFTGPRSQLEELLNRYHGASDPAPWNPDHPDWTPAELAN